MRLHIITGMLLTLLTATGGYAADSVTDLVLRAAPPANNEKKSSLKVAIISFEDARPISPINPDHQPRIGLRTQIGGDTTYYHIKDGPIGAAVAQTLASALKQRGMNAWVVQAGDGRSEQSADVTIRGQVLDFWAHANSQTGSTRLTTKVDLAMETMNHDNRNDRSSMARKIVASKGQQDETFYQAADLEKLLNATLNSTFAKYFENMAIDEGQTGIRRAAR